MLSQLAQIASALYLLAALIGALSGSDLDQGLTAHWNFDEGSGAVLTDVTGNGNTGTITGASWTTGKSGSALAFSGTSTSTVNVGGNTFGITDSLSISLWFNISGGGGDYYQTLFTRSNARPFGIEITGQNNNTQTARSTIRITNNFDLSYVSSGFVARNSWRHVVLTYDSAGNQNFYLDGQLVGSNTIASPALFMGWGGETTSIGTNFQGSIDDIRVYNRALSALEVTDLFGLGGDTGDGGGGTPASDTTAPSIPTGLTATSTSSTQVNLSWTASTDNVGVTGYRVYRNGGFITTVSSTSYTDSNVSASTTYTYTVAAYDSAGNLSAQSSGINITTPATAPSSYTLTVSATNGTVTGTGINCGVDCTETVSAGSSVTLTATPNSGYNFSGWSGGGCSGTSTCAVTLNSNVTVTASFSSQSAPAPIISNVSVDSVGSTSATISWQTNEASSNQVEYGLTTSYGSSTTVGAGSLNHSRTITGLSPSTTYHFRVRAVSNTSGTSGVSGDYTFTTLAQGSSPIARITVLPGTTVEVGELVYLDGLNSTDDRSLDQAHFEWDYGDGYTAFGSTFAGVWYGTDAGNAQVHFFMRPGVFPVTLTVTDTDGNVNSVTQNITVTGEAPMSGFEVWMAPTNARIAQFLYPQIPSAYRGNSTRLVVTLSGDNGYATTTLLDKSNLAASEKILLQNATLPAGNYVIQAELRNASNQRLAGGIIREKFSKSYNGAPTVGIDEHNSLYFNGEPYFPVTPWLEYRTEFLPTYNTFFGLSSGYATPRDINNFISYLNYADSLGVKMQGPLPWDGIGAEPFWRNSDLSRMAEYINAAKNHPAMAIWAWIDEPSLGGTESSLPPSVLAAWTETTHRNDPQRPVNNNMYGYSYLANVNFDDDDNYTYLYGSHKLGGKKHAIQDILGFDIYPIVFQDFHALASSTRGPIDQYAEAIDQMLSRNANLLPSFSFVEVAEQATNFPQVLTWGPAYEPTAAQITMEAWLNVVHNIKGINWFYFNAVPAANQAAMAQFKTDVEALKDVVLGAPPSRTLSDTSNVRANRVDTMIRETATDVWVFAVRVTEPDTEWDELNGAAFEPVSINTNFTISGLSNTVSAEVYNESRSVSVTNGAFTDSFGREAVHIYRIPKSGGSVDATAPSVPTGLAANPVSSSQINLSWTASTDNIGVAGYRVYRGGSQIATTTTTNYSDINLNASTGYSYTVSAYDASGNASSQSGSVSATTQSAVVSDTTPPVRSNGLPTGTASAGTTSAVLSLTTNEAATCKYGASAGTAYASLPNTFTVTGATSHSSVLSGLSNGSAYTYYVRCQDQAGNPNVTDLTISFSIASPPADTTAPVISSILSSVSTSTQALITWTTNEAAINQVQYGLTTSYNQQSATSTVSSTSHAVTLTGLSPSNTYHYRVVVIDGSGNRAVSSDRTFSTPGLPDTTPPGAVTNLAASSISYNSALLSWTAPGDDNGVGLAASYDIRYSLTPILSNSSSSEKQSWWDSATVVSGEPTPQVAGSPETDTLTSLSAQKTYYVMMTAIDDASNVSAFSSIISFTTLAAPVVSEPEEDDDGGGGGGGGGGSFRPTNTTTSALDPEESFLESIQVLPAEKQVTLKWKNPSDSKFARVFIVRSAKEFEQNLSGKDLHEKYKDEVVYEDKTTEFTDIGLDNTKDYFYALAYYDRDLDYSSPKVIKTKPESGKTSIEVKEVPGAFLGDASVAAAADDSEEVAVSFRRLTKTLSLRDESDEVTLLQTFLASDPELYPEGEITGFFGPLTQRAVERFQIKYGIVSQGSPALTGFGQVGPQTLAKLNEVFGSASPSAPSVPSPSTPSAASPFQTPLFLDLSHPDVLLLQQLLNQDPDTKISDSGPGSPGHETDFFGPLTQRAVERFQLKYNLALPADPGYGYVGPKTREKLNELLTPSLPSETASPALTEIGDSTSASSTSTSTPITPETSTSTSESIESSETSTPILETQSELLDLINQLLELQSQLQEITE